MKYLMINEWHEKWRLFCEYTSCWWKFNIFVSISGFWFTKVIHGTNCNRIMSGIFPCSQTMECQCFLFHFFFSFLLFREVFTCTLDIKHWPLRNWYKIWKYAWMYIVTTRLKSRINCGLSSKRLDSVKTKIRLAESQTLEMTPQLRIVIIVVVMM